MSLLIPVISGIIVALLVDYLSDVLPVSRRFTRPVCSVCHQPYTIMDYAVFHKCTKCGHSSLTKFIIILIPAVVLSILVKFFPFSTLSFWASLPILILLGVIMVIDIEHRAVLVETSLLGFVLFLIYGIILRGLLRTILGGLVGFLTMYLIYGLGKAFSRIAGRLRHQSIDEVAFGFGDVTTGTILGLLVGWSEIFRAMTISFLLFGAFTLILFFALLLTKKYSAFSNALPFTPFLIIGAIAIFYL
jgi:prepilin signal peptidase PulO-like enzyme (type II secretory pathway)